MDSNDDTSDCQGGAGFTLANRRTPHQSQRKLSPTPTTRRLTWCMHCFRMFLANWDGDSPLSIPCVDAVGSASTRCQQCISRNRKCEPVHEGIFGEAVRLQAILEFVSSHFKEADHSDAVISPESMVSLVVLVRNLLAAFNALLGNHRKQFHLATSSKIPADIAASDEDNVQSRRVLISHRPAPAGATAPQLLAAEATSYCSARVTDQGYSSWAIGVNEFKQDFFDLVMSQPFFDDHSDEQKAATRASMEGIYPVSDLLM